VADSGDDRYQGGRTKDTMDRAATVKRFTLLQGYIIITLAQVHFRPVSCARSLRVRSCYIDVFRPIEDKDVHLGHHVFVHSVVLLFHLSQP